MDSNYRFFTRRAAEEAARAERSITPAARELHQRLAAVFHARARDARAGEEQLTMELVR